jgi:hypothetical protein
MTRKTSYYARKRLAHRQPAMSSIAAAQMFISRLTPTEQAKLIGSLPAIRTRLLRATYSFEDYVQLTTARHHSRASNDLGLVRDMQGVLDAADQVLTLIGQDCEPTPGQWAPRAMRATELAAIDDLMAIYRASVQEATYSEWTAIQDLAVARVRSTRGDVYTDPAQVSAANQGRFA